MKHQYLKLLIVLSLVMMVGCAKEENDTISFVNEPQKVIETTNDREVVVKSDGAVTTKQEVIVNSDEVSTGSEYIEAETNVLTDHVVTSNVVISNNAPIITISNLSIEKGAIFNPLDGISVKDVEDGEIEITLDNITSNPVNTSKCGEYTVVYAVMDSDGNTSTAKRLVTVYNPDATMLDDDGNLELVYSEVDDASLYKVYMMINGTPTLLGTTKNTEYTVEFASSQANRNKDCVSEPFYITTACKYNNVVYKYLDAAKNTIAFKIAAVDADGNESMKETIVYEVSEMVDTIPMSAEMSTTPKYIQFKLNEEGLPDEADLDVMFRYVSDSTYEGISDVVIADETTSKLGKLSSTYYRNNGLSFTYAFEKAGTYELTIRIYDKNTTYYNETSEITIREPFKLYEFIEATKVSVTQLYGDSYKAGLSLGFELSEDLDLTDTDASVMINVYYDYESSDDIDDYSVITVNYSDYYDITELKKDKTYTVTLSNDMKELLPIWTYIVNHDITYMKAEVVVSDTDGDETSAITRNIYKADRY